MADAGRRYRRKLREHNQLIKVKCKPEKTEIAKGKEVDPSKVRQVTSDDLYNNAVSSYGSLEAYNERQMEVVK